MDFSAIRTASGSEEEDADAEAIVRSTNSPSPRLRRRSNENRMFESEDSRASRPCHVAKAIRIEEERRGSEI